MFMLNDKPLALDTPFTVGEGDEAIQYPANWLRLASADEKAAIGIVELNDPQPYDDRFYWGVDNPKDLDMVKAMLTSQVKATAASLLAPTDWKIVRFAETGTAVSDDVKTYRADVRSASNEHEATIAAATSVDELAALQFNWPTQGE